jgi:hypothetical protein
MSAWPEMAGGGAIEGGGLGHLRGGGGLRRRFQATRPDSFGAEQEGNETEPQGCMEELGEASNGGSGWRPWRARVRVCAGKRRGRGRG